MIRSLAICFSLLLFQGEGNAKRRHHVIYWNTVMNPGLLSTSEHTYYVKIGEFLDILCPQNSLMGITDGLEEPETFNLYNVTQTDFEQCSHGDNKNFIFACDRPERENKLTIKFQTISPSPLGFRFQYCSEYYFVAASRDPNKRTNSCNKNSMRLRIFVECRETRHHKHDKKTTTASTTTTTTLPTTTITKVRTTTSRKPRIVLPNVEHSNTTKSIPDKKPSEDPETLRQIKNRRRNNSSSCLSFSINTLTLTFFVYVITTWVMS
uniref:Ephrin n=1 Tax=Ciona intestinalis TaxID=7719 RepID=Q4H3M0_CIOIN|nr:ephrin precursor [Ciona intestinalis]BAE06407.1 ephrin [Ciona intestinalis]|eukprot:NP_001071693.1 ephrin precursor [Ciona intestinalis]